MSLTQQSTPNLAKASLASNIDTSTTMIKFL